jgi:hypothetical protein
LCAQHKSKKAKAICLCCFAAKVDVYISKCIEQGLDLFLPSGDGNALPPELSSLIARWASESTLGQDDVTYHKKHLESEGHLNSPLRDSILVRPVLRCMC